MVDRRAGRACATLECERRAEQHPSGAWYDAHANRWEVNPPPDVDLGGVSDHASDHHSRYAEKDGCGNGAAAPAGVQEAARRLSRDADNTSDCRPYQKTDPDSSPRSPMRAVSGVDQCENVRMVESGVDADFLEESLCSLAAQLLGRAAGPSVRPRGRA